MSIDKFGSHIFNKDTSTDNILKILDVSKVKLYYHTVLTCVGKYNPTSKVFDFVETNKGVSIFHIVSGTIVKVDYPKLFVSLLINSIPIAKPEGVTLKKGDLISFRRTSSSTLTSFYGELYVRCPVEIET